MDILTSYVNKLQPDDLTWVLSFFTLWSMYLAGEMKLKAWKIGLLNQFFWVVYIVWAQKYGLIPMNVGMWFMCARNYLLWKGTDNIWLSAIFLHPKSSLRELLRSGTLNPEIDTQAFETAEVSSESVSTNP